MTAYQGYEDASWKLTKDQEKFFDKMEKELKVPITVINGRSQKRVRPADAEGIIFYDYATNSESPTPRRIDSISRRNGTNVALKNGHLLKEDNREHIFDFNGFPLCEIRFDTIWGLTPLENFSTDKLMMEFWADALRMCRNEEFFRQKEEERKKTIRDAFVKTMKDASEVEVKQLEQEIQQASTSVSQLDTQLFEAHAKLYKSQHRLEVAKQLTDGEKSYEDEIAALLDHEGVKSIDFNTSTAMLEVYTRPIYIYSPDMTERALLGEFLVKINTKSSNAITLHNLTNQRSQKMHPHVEANGHPCWGGTSSQVAKLATTGKLEGLIDLVIRYLEGYNPSDSYARYAHYWFTPKDTQKRREEFGEWMTDDEYKEAKKNKKTEIKDAGSKDELKVEEEVITEKTLQEINN